MKWTDAIKVFLVQYGFQILGALIILGIGFVVALWVGKLIDAALKQKVTYAPMRLLLVRIARLLILVFAGVLALDKFGVQTASLIAGISVVGVGISLAAQGVLSNLVAGLLIIFSKPFLVDEYVEVAGVDGRVENIELFTTTLVRGDRSRVLIPNRKIVGEIVHNHGRRRQLLLKVGVAYDSDVSLVIATVRKVLQENKRVLADPAPWVGVTALEDSSVGVSIAAWAQLPDWGAARVEIYAAVLEEFAKAGIEIPFPQRVVTMLGQ